MDESSSQQPQQKLSRVEVAKKRFAQPKVWIPTVIVVAFLLTWWLFNLRESTLIPLSLKARDWTGLGADSTTNIERDSAGKVIKTIEVVESSKTLWDWLSVLGVPLTLALLGFWFQALQQKQAAEQAKVERERAEKQAEVEKERASAQAEVERARTEKQAEVEKELAEIARREEAIQIYFDRLSDLLVDKNLIAIASKVQCFEAEIKDKAKQEGSGSEEIELPARLLDQKDRLDAAVDVIRARTLAILRRLENDADRKTSVMQFLLESEVVQKLKLSLSNANLSGADLSGADLSNADLSNADLSNADLRFAELKSADLSLADLSHANLSYADLRSANLGSASLSSAYLKSAKLSGSDLSGATLSDATLSDAYLKSADLSDASLNSADLSGSDLSDANLKSADLSGSNLKSADLSGSYLANADLSDADLSGSDLSGAILFKADLRDSKGLQENQLTGTKPPLLCATKLPDGMDSLSDRDCDRLPQVWMDRYPGDFQNLDKAKQWVEEQRKKQP